MASKTTPTPTGRASEREVPRRVPAQPVDGMWPLARRNHELVALAPRWGSYFGFEAVTGLGRLSNVSTYSVDSVTGALKGYVLKEHSDDKMEAVTAAWKRYF